MDPFPPEDDLTELFAGVALLRDRLSPVALDFLCAIVF